MCIYSCLSLCTNAYFCDITYSLKVQQGSVDINVGNRRKIFLNNMKIGLDNHNEETEEAKMLKSE